MNKNKYEDEYIEGVGYVPKIRNQPTHKQSEKDRIESLKRWNNLSKISMRKILSHTDGCIYGKKRTTSIIDRSV